MNLKHTEADNDSRYFKEYRGNRKHKCGKKETLISLSGLDDRTLRQAIEDERKAGNLICSTTGHNGGYYLPSSIVDVRAYVKEQENRMKSQAVALAPFKEHIRKAGKNESIV